MKTTAKKKIRMSRLGPAECATIVAMLRILIAQETGGDVGLIVGAGVEHLDKERKCFSAESSEETEAVCTSLVERGIFVTQCGDEYEPRGATATKGDDVWYSFNTYIFKQGNEPSEDIRLRLLRQIHPHIPGDTLETLLLDGLTLTGAIYD